MRKPQPVKIFDAAALAPQAGSSVTTATHRSVTPLSFLFRDRQVRSPTSAASCATPLAHRRFGLAPQQPTVTTQVETNRMRPESAPPSECHMIVRPAEIAPATVLETVRLADDAAQSKANTLPTRLNYVLLVNDDSAHRCNSKPQTDTAAEVQLEMHTGVQQSVVQQVVSNSEHTPPITPPKRSFTQKLRRLFSISKTATLHNNTYENCDSAHRMELANTPTGNARVAPLASDAHATAFRPVQPRSRPLASTNTRIADAGSRDSSVRRLADERTAGGNLLCASAAGSPERTSLSSQNRNGFLANLTLLRQRGWYWGPLTSEQAEWLLAEKEDGSFLVRDSSHDMYILSLSFRSNGITGHVRIEHQGGKFRFTSEPASYHAASSIVEFIEKAMEYSRSGRFQYFVQATAPGQPPLPVTLLRPVSRFETVARLQHLCRFEILKHTRCDHVDSLPLPVSLKEYLKQKQFYVDISTLPGEPTATTIVAANSTSAPSNANNSTRVGHLNS